jgi:hypothetical protein
MQSTDNHLERALDAALAMTFPASDPVAILVAKPAWIRPDSEQMYAEERSDASKQFSRTNTNVRT